MYVVSGFLLALYIPPSKPLCLDRYSQWIPNMGTYTARTAVEPICRRRRGPATVNSHRHGASNSGDNHARKRTE